MSNKEIRGFRYKGDRGQKIWQKRLGWLDAKVRRDEEDISRIVRNLKGAKRARRGGQKIPGDKGSKEIMAKTRTRRERDRIAGNGAEGWGKARCAHHHNRNLMGA